MTTVECPLCGEEFDTTTAGGWCTNPECGEYQHVDPADEGDDESGTDPLDELDLDAPAPTLDPDESTAEDAFDVEFESDDADDGAAAVVEAEADEAAADAGETTDADAEPSQTACPSCGTTVDADANFCPGCGEELDAAEPEPLTECPSCGRDVDEEDAFCASCGENLDRHRGTTEPPETIALAVGETRVVVGDDDVVGREVRTAHVEAGGDPEEAQYVHREHVRFVREADGFYMIDEGRNTTTLNGEDLTVGDRRAVADGDRIGFSNVVEATVRYD
jgi:RNA polymerase subunit RPABC4/transcription elongation factor Spt4